MTTVLLIKVLDDLLTPLVLEVDIDVGRLVALARDEALEQHRHARGIDLGDAEAITHRGVRRRAAPLTEDAATARERDQIVHGEEIGFVTELGDEREFVLDQRAHIGRHVIAQRRRPAPALHGAAFDEFTQPLGGRTPLGHDLARIFIAQLIERESATRRDGPRRSEQRGRIEACETLAFTQMPLAGGLQREPGRIDRGAEADRRQRIVQPTPRPQMHAYRTGRHERQIVRRTERRERRQMRPLCAIAQQFGSDPGRTRKMRA